MTLGLWLFYILGGIASMLKRANLAAKSPLTPQWTTIKEYAQAHAGDLATNWVLSTALFWTVWHDPSLLASALSVFGIDKPVPLNPFTAAIYGVFSDVIMDFVVAKIKGRFGALKPN